MDGASPGAAVQIHFKIDDYSTEGRLRSLLRGYNDLLTEYIARNGFKFFMHSREYF